MVTMIVTILRTKPIAEQKLIVQRISLNAQTVFVCLKNGFVMAKMIAEILQVCSLNFKISTVKKYNVFLFSDESNCTRS